MQPTQFIAKWQANARTERAAAQEHFLDLCALLSEPTPNTDPTGAAYAFEKGATKASGGEGWADVWRRGRFAWEYKGKHRDLDAAHQQLLQYAGALENPPLLVTSDLERIVVRTNWTNAVSERHEIRLPELADPARLAVLKWVFSDPERLRPGTTREALTAEAAARFAELARRLRARGHDAQSVAHFVNRLVFCLFADDVGLLPPGLFERMLDAARKAPARFADYAARLFAAMAQRGGEVDFTPVAWFNGGLFDDAASLPLDGEDVALLQQAAALDWAEVDPSILGTLFERGLDPDARSQLGAHYTSRDMIARLIEPVVHRPLLAEWEAAKAVVTAERARVDALRARRIRRAGPKTEAAEDAAVAAPYRAFLDRLRAFRVLDSACGSGNFLYLSLLALKDLEHRAMVEAEALGLQREFPQVGPEAVLGIGIGIDVARRDRDVWIVDFTGLTAEAAAYYSAPYAYVVAHVKPLRDKNARDTRRERWWLHGDAQPRMRAAIGQLGRCIVTAEVSRHRTFVWTPRPVLPDSKLMVIARDDDTTLGMLHSRFHELWSLGVGSWHGVGNDPRYTPSTTFETFPFPADLSPDRLPAAYAADPRAQAIASAAHALTEARDRWLNPPELVQRVPEIVPGFPDRLLPAGDAAAAQLRRRTLTALYNLRGTPEGAWLDNLHRTLDAAVAAAYGWPATLSDDEILARLLSENQARGGRPR